MKKIDALKKIMEGLQVLIDLESTSSEPQKENKILNLEEKRREKESLKEDVIEVKEGKITNESLESMTYSDLKKLAKDFGIDDKGPKSALLKRLQESDLEVEVPEEETEIEEVEDGVKVTDLKEDAEEEEIEEEDDDIEDDLEEEDEDTDEEDTDDEVDEIEKRVMEAVEEMETEEIADILAEHGIKAKGKRQALIAKLIKAVEDGVIEFADDEDEEDSDFEIDLTDFDEDDLKAILEELGVKIPKKAKKKDLIDLIEDQDEEKVMQVIQELSEGDDEEEDQEETEDDEDKDEENEVEYGVNDLNNPEMTKKRKKMLKAHIEETEDAVEEGEFSEEDFIDFLEENTEISRKKLEKKSLEELKDMYIDITARFISDEGNFIEDEEEEYTVNGVAYMNGEPIED